MNKRFLTIFFTLLFVVLCMFAFFFKKPENTFVFWTIQLKPVASDFILRNVEIFEKKHPDIKITWVDIPIAEAQKRILASILGGNPPDLVNLNPDFSSLLAQIGALEIFGEEETKDFLPNLLEGLKFENKIFGIPFYATSPVTVINSNCTKNTPKTYGDILTIENKCQNAFSINLNENDTLSRILNKYQVYNMNDEDSLIKTQHVFDMFKKMYDESIIPKDTLTINHREAVEKYMAGDTAICVMGGNFVKMVMENAKNVYEVSLISPQLTSSDGGFDVSLMNFVIPSKSKNKELAREFLFQITGFENQLEFAKLTNVLPTRYDALHDSFFKCNKGAALIDEARCVGAIQLKDANYKTFGYKNKKEINDILNEALENYLLENKFSVKTLSRQINQLQNN